MDCNEHWPTTAEYLEALYRKADERRVPTSGTMSLTDRCNLDCVHCYAGPHRAADSGRCLEEMSTDEVLSCLDQVAQAGCLSLLLSGGEPLLRTDFPTIYKHAKLKGFIVTVFTNGTLIDDGILDLFEELPPHEVEISLYGTTPSTYESITRTPRSFKRCLVGIERLRKRRIRLKLKTILMTLNRHEFAEIEELARNGQMDFRFDAAIFPTLGGDLSPIQLRVPAEEAIALEFFDQKRAEDWTRYFLRSGSQTSSNALYQCGAGRSTFHIDPTGRLQPCLMVTDEKYSFDLKTGSFEDGWANVVAGIREATPGVGYACNKCQKRTLCGLCPGFNRLEMASEDEFSEYACSLGQLRYRAIQEKLSQGGTR